MEKREFSYIGQVTYAALRNYILDNNLTEFETIKLHPMNFDNIILEYRTMYKESLKVPFYIFKTRIEADSENKVPTGRLLVLTEKSRLTKRQITERENEPIYETIYRCGWCGNVVDYDGREFDSQTRIHKIKILENKNNFITQKTVDGKCCQHKSH